MKQLLSIFKKPYIYAITFSIILLALSAYTLLDAFIIPHDIKEFTATGTTSSNQQTDQEQLSSTSSSKQNNSANNESTSTPVITDNSYQDSNISITISTIRSNNTNVYIADVKLSGIEYLKTALANNRFGTNITAKTSAIASSNNAILAVNGDYYGANKSGYVIKNGSLLRNSIRGDSEYEDLVILPDGNFQIISEKNTTADALLSQGVSQLFAFGPTLIKNGTISINTNTEVDQSMSSNPRTAIGIIEPLHYLFVVSDGRTTQNPGLSLYQLASIMSEHGCQTAYNLDGGGSSTMYFNGNVINNPTTNGKSISERAVSDIVYIGY